MFDTAVQRIELRKYIKRHYYTEIDTIAKLADWVSAY